LQFRPSWRSILVLPTSNKYSLVCMELR
jgi:hypothetical protein